MVGLVVNVARLNEFSANLGEYLPLGPNVMNFLSMLRSFRLHLTAQSLENEQHALFSSVLQLASSN